MLFNIIACLIIIISSFIFAYKNYKKCETVLERIFCVSMFFVVLVPIFLYYFDRYNVPTILTWSENVNTQNWLAFFSSYLSSIVGAVISSVVLVIVTVLQMNRTLKETQERDKEERRINNMPLLEYKIFSNDDRNKKICRVDTIFETGFTCGINLKIKNIGMNSVRKSFVVLSSPEVKKSKCFEVDNQSCIYKEETKELKFLLILPDGEYKFTLKVYYEDLLKNWYVQKVEISYIVIDYKIIGKINLDYKVYDEKRLKKIPFKIKKS